MFGKWAYGFWQCKNRYKSQDEILGVARKYGELHIPADDIVQDWFLVEPQRRICLPARIIPTPKSMVDQLHAENFHLMLSIWPFFEPGSSNYDYMKKQAWFVDQFKKYLKPPYHTDAMAVYDATNPEARKFYCRINSTSLYNIGIDAWWMDTTEPETEGQEENILLGHKLAAGSGDRYVNAYPLLDTAAVYQGQRASSDQKRVFILSRSAFSGSQRNSVTAWSGDINSDWLSFRRQIPAGLNFAVSGIPYWTTDIGGFVFGSPTDPAFRELFVRWFQWGTFNPILRVHGTRNPDENRLWSYGEDAQKVLVDFDRLRYRLLPYIYSLAWKTTSEAYTTMRPLVMDFRTDARAIDISDQFMYGPAFSCRTPSTASPQPRAARSICPMRSGHFLDRRTDRRTEVESRPQRPQIALRSMFALKLHRSIRPRDGMVPRKSRKIQSSYESIAAPMASSHSTKTKNDNYNYEKGKYATIPFSWNDTKQTLTIGEQVKANSQECCKGEPSTSSLPEHPRHGHQRARERGQVSSLHRTTSRRHSLTFRNSKSERRPPARPIEAIHKHGRGQWHSQPNSQIRKVCGENSYNPRYARAAEIRHRKHDRTDARRCCSKFARQERDCDGINGSKAQPRQRRAASQANRILRERINPIMPAHTPITIPIAPPIRRSYSAERTGAAHLPTSSAQ